MQHGRGGDSAARLPPADRRVGPRLRRGDHLRPGRWRSGRSVCTEHALTCQPRHAGKGRQRHQDRGLGPMPGAGQHGLDRQQYPTGRRTPNLAAVPWRSVACTLENRNLATGIRGVTRGRPRVGDTLSLSFLTVQNDTIAPSDPRRRARLGIPNVPERGGQAVPSYIFGVVNVEGRIVPFPPRLQPGHHEATWACRPRGFCAVLQQTTTADG